MKRHKSLGNLRRSLSTLYLRISGTNNSLVFDRDFCKKYFKGPLSAEVAESIAHRWSSLLNDSSLTVVTVQLAKFKHHPGLGISLEGTVDVLETGAEVRPHHYIRAIQPDGPVAADGTLRPHDELLEVNGKKLYGLNHLEVVEILKNLPKYVRIVCARPVQNRLQQEDGDVAAACRDDADSLDIDQMDDDDLMTTRSRTTRESQPEADLSAADGNANTATLPSRGGSGSGNNKSQSFDDFSNTGYWSNIPTVVELEKTPAGLGFSVLDYQDPLSADETVIIIRSLVPNGAAHRDGRLLPGDRLLFVNDTNLERASLEETVRCLKSAPRGRIAIGVAKPRPLASASAERKTSIVDNRHLPASSGPRQRRQQQWLKTELLDAEAEIDDEEDELVLMRPPRQVAFGGATSISYFGASTPPQVRAVSQPMQLQLPQSMERCLHIRPRPGDTLELGLVVESVDSGVNGCIIRRVLEGGLAHSEGSLQPCDFVTAVNSESLRRLTTSEARERLRCAGALGRDLFIRYYSAADISRHLTSFKSHQSESQSSAEHGLHSRYEYAIVHYSDEDQRSGSMSPQPTKPARTNGAVDSESIIYLDEDERALAEAAAEQVPTEAEVPTADEEPAATPAQTLPQAREKSLSLDGSPANANASSWSEPRLVRLRRDANRSLGVSIVGGRVNGHDLQQGISGVFIKQVAEAESNRRDGVLRTGDRILAVCGQDLTHATHDEAVNLIRNAPSPVEFCIQSLLNPSCDYVLLVMPSDSESSSRPALTPEPPIAEVPAWDVGADEATDGNPATAGTLDSAETRHSNSNSVPATVSGDDEFGYPLADPDKHLSIKYPGYLSVCLLAIEKSGRHNLGLALSGHRDPGQVSVFVCGIRPDGAAAADGRLKVGDELLEVNGQSLQGKSHLNAAPVIAECSGRIVKLVVARRSDSIASMAVKPLQPPHSLPFDAEDGNTTTTTVNSAGPIAESDSLKSAKEEAQTPAAVTEQPTGNGVTVKVAEEATTTAQSADDSKTVDSVGKYGVEITCTLVKGKQGLGFAIMESNAEDEPGIYVKHITEKGPAAAEGSLRTGDRLIKANEFLLAEATYDEALEKLRSMSGQVVITVARRLQSADGADGAAPGATQAAQPVAGAPTKTKQRKEVRIALPPEAADSDAAAKSSRAAVPAAATAASNNCQGDSTKNKEEGISETAKSAGQHMVKDGKDKRDSNKPPELSDAQSSSANPATRQIVAGQETTIEIDKGSSSLGLSIVGGSDTTLNAIVIHEVYDTGAAWKDRRLWAGDQILSVDDRDLSNVTHEEAKNIILQAGPRVKLRVWRDDKEITEDDLYDKLRIELTRKQGMGLGFSIVARSNDEGVLVSDIIKGGVAESDKRLQPGDRILEVNGRDMRKTPHAEVATILKSSQGKVSFLIGRLKHVGVVKSKRKAAFTVYEVNLQSRSASELGIKFTSQPSHMLDAPAQGAAPHQGIFVSNLENDGPAIKSGKIRPDDELFSVNENLVDGMTIEEANQLIDRHVGTDQAGSVLLRFRRWEELAGRLTVKLIRNSSRHGMLGFSIVGGRGTPQGDHPIYVRTVTDESAAKNLLFKGDRIDFVNGRSLDGLSHDEAVAILKAVVGDMTLVIHRPAAVPSAS